MKDDVKIQGGNSGEKVKKGGNKTVNGYDAKVNIYLIIMLEQVIFLKQIKKE